MGVKNLTWGGGGGRGLEKTKTPRIGHQWRKGGAAWLEMGRGGGV